MRPNTTLAKVFVLSPSALKLQYALSLLPAGWRIAHASEVAHG